MEYTGVHSEEWQRGKLSERAEEGEYGVLREDWKRVERVR